MSGEKTPKNSDRINDRLFTPELSQDPFGQYSYICRICNLKILKCGNKLADIDKDNKELQNLVLR